MDFKNISVNEINDLIFKSVKEPLTIDEAALLDCWVALNSENADYYVKVKSIFTVDAIKKATDIDENLKNSLLNDIRQRSKRKKITFTRIVAAVVAIFVIGLSFTYFNNTIDYTVAEVHPHEEHDDYGVVILRQKEKIDLKSTIPSSILFNAESREIRLEKDSADDDLITIIIQPGNSYKATLPDSSTVWLNAGSKLSFRSQFAKREVELQGEACFDVEGDKDHPFTIKLSESKSVTVLGTFFNIKSYREDSTTTISLLRGSVRCDLDSKKVILAPYEEVQVNNDNGVIISKLSDENAVAWINGSIVYNNEKFETIARDLSRRYNFHFEIKNKLLREERLTININNCSLDYLIKHLRKAGNRIFNIELKNGQVEIY